MSGLTPIYSQELDRRVDVYKYNSLDDKDVYNFYFNKSFINSLDNGEKKRIEKLNTRGNYYDIGLLKFKIVEFNGITRFYFEKNGETISISLNNLPRAKGTSRFAFRILEEGEKDDLKKAREEELSSLRSKEREITEARNAEKRMADEEYRNQLVKLFKVYFDKSNEEAREIVQKISEEDITILQAENSNQRGNIDISKDKLSNFLLKIGGKKRKTKRRRTKRRRPTKRRPTKRRR